MPLPMLVLAVYFNYVFEPFGAQVQIFNPNEFPDVPSGSVSERLVALGYESFIRIDSNTLLTDKDTKRYSAEAVELFNF